MQWHLNAPGWAKPIGPMDEDTIVDMIKKSGGVAPGLVIKAEDSELWVPVQTHAPFAMAIAQLQQVQSKPQDGIGCGTAALVILVAVPIVTIALLALTGESKPTTEPTPPRVESREVIPDTKQQESEGADRIDAQWAVYDLVAKDEVQKELMLQVISECKAIANQYREPTRSALLKYHEEQTRRRFAKVGNIKSHTAGTGSKTLVPSDTYAECVIWGSQWARDKETASALRSVGFESIECVAGNNPKLSPAKEWKLK